MKNTKNKPPKPDSLEIKPNNIKIMPSNVKIKPDSAKINPESVKIKIKPESFKIKPDSNKKIKPDSNKKIKPENAKIKPDSLKIKPEKAKIKPDSLKIKPDNAKLKPDSLKIKPDKIEIKPDNIEIKPDDKKKEPLVVAGMDVSAKQYLNDHVEHLREPLVVVGIGASAGGLESFEKFFHNLTPDSGIAFVLISHLDPSHSSMLAEIMQRSTKMQVLEVQDGMEVAANHVYVIPPNWDISIFRGALQLSAPEKNRGQRMPIDYFFRSLAEDQGKKSIGVILSGTGTDGTFGLRAILGAGGTSFVEDPATAKYDGMPSSAVRNDLATYVLAVDEMPQKLLSHISKKFKKEDKVPAPLEDSTITDSGEIIKIIRSATKHDFSLYKKNTLGRRIEHRMEVNGIESIKDYARYLRGNPLETQILFEEMLINVTNFFRDSEAFEILKKDIIPQLFLDKPEDYCFRIWVPGCSSGEEAYSIAICFREYMDEINQNFKIQIYATDINEKSILAARLGAYPENISIDVSPDRLKQFFIKDAGRYKVKKVIREMITFAVQSVTGDPPFIKIDLISCRNLLIYLEPQLQKFLISIFSYALKSNGFLFLGSAETVGSMEDLFVVTNKKHKFFKSSSSSKLKITKLFDSFASRRINKNQQSEMSSVKTTKVKLAELINMELLKSFVPSSVVVDGLGNILFVHGDTGKYLRPAPGPASLNIIEMARLELKSKISTAIREAITLRKLVEYNNITVKNNGDIQVINLIVRSLDDGAGPSELLLVSFQEINRKPKEESPAAVKLSAKKNAAQALAELEKELAYEKEAVIAITEEAQASNEELKSSNEELQSSNEELQSTNEELDTSREEMQSVNEELLTVNSELSAKIDQLAEIQNDLKNLLENINVGTIFLDIGLNIKRYTKLATKLFHLIPSDIGRPFKDINSSIAVSDLITKAKYSLEMFTIHEEEVPSADGKWYLMRVLPYHTTEEIVDGIVITFTEITQIKNIQNSLFNASEVADNILNIYNTMREPLLTLDENLRVISANKSFYDFFKVDAEDTIDNLVYNLGNKQWDIPKLRVLLEEILPKDREFAGYEVEHEFLNIGHKIMLLNARIIAQKESGSKRILLAIEDITSQRQIDKTLQLTSLYTRNLIETSLDPLVTISAEGKITDVNNATEKVTGVSRQELIGWDFVDLFTEPEMAREGYLKAFKQGQIINYPLAIRHISGTVTDVLYNASVYRNEQGKVLGVFATARDITKCESL